MTSYFLTVLDSISSKVAEVHFNAGRLDLYRTAIYAGRAARRRRCAA